MKLRNATERIIALLLALILFPIVLVISVLIKLSSSGDIFFCSKRVGIENKIFLMTKFSTMRPVTPKVATHLLHDPEQYYTRVGSFLRKTSLDEIPQLLSILKGDMSFIGPRPALFNQDDLIKLRTEKGIHQLKPGITGWAQVNGRDVLSISDKVKMDEYYLKNQSLWLNIKILFKTVIKVFKMEGVSH
jgi:O-antigen biosynthesis protein WbqP